MKRRDADIFTKLIMGMTALSLLASCGKQGLSTEVLLSEDMESSDIKGGRRVEDADPLSKYAVAIKTGPVNEASTCTGVVIANDMVLTAAHCMRPGQKPLIRVLFGMKGFEHKEERYVSYFDVHPAYLHSNYPKRYDVAVLRLRHPVPAEYKPIAIYQNQIAVNQTLKALGVGATSYDISTVDPMVLQNSLRLRTLDMQVDSLTLDRNEFRTRMTLVKGVSQGDSGGPLLTMVGQMPFVVGIASQIDIGNGPMLATYTWVKPLEKWIQSSMSRMRALK